MLNRRSFLSFLSCLPFFGTKSESLNEPMLRASDWYTIGEPHRNGPPAQISDQSAKVPFIPKEILNERYRKVFPEGFHITEENVQKLLDNGFAPYQFFFTFSGRFNRDGVISYYKDSLLHREDGPAFIGIHGAEYWMYGEGILYVSAKDYKEEDNPKYLEFVRSQLSLDNDFVV